MTKTDTQKAKVKKRQACLTLFGYVLIFFFISFSGWIFEKTGRYFLYNSVDDRGFLTLPFCPIYGTCILLMGKLIGSPQTPSHPIEILFDRFNQFSKPVRFFLRLFFYFLAATIISTAVELLVGACFQSAGIPLWNYIDRMGNIAGIICLGYSLLWGFLITLVMGLVWNPLCRLIQKISARTQKILSLLLIVLVLFDFLFNCIYVIQTGERFHFL